jgi:hypothetical protein
VHSIIEISTSQLFEVGLKNGSHAAAEWSIIGDSELPPPSGPACSGRDHCATSSNLNPGSKFPFKRLLSVASSESRLLPGDPPRFDPDGPFVESGNGAAGSAWGAAYSHFFLLVPHAEQDGRCLSQRILAAMHAKHEVRRGGFGALAFRLQ